MQPYHCRVIGSLKPHASGPESVWSSKRSRLADDEMLDLFLSMLDVRARSIECVVGQDEFPKSVLDEVKTWAINPSRGGGRESRATRSFERRGME